MDNCKSEEKAGTPTSSISRLPTSLSATEKSHIAIFRRRKQTWNFPKVPENLSHHVCVSFFCLVAAGRMKEKSRRSRREEGEKKKMLN